MNDAERLILLGIDAILRTQAFPKDPTAMDEHVKRLTDDIHEWRRLFRLMIAAPRDPAPPTGCADDQLPGTAADWRNVARAKITVRDAAGVRSYEDWLAVLESHPHAPTCECIECWRALERS